jgi:hypothetical protein
MKYRLARARDSRFSDELSPSAIAPQYETTVATDLQIVIPHRTPKQTRAALKYAAALAGGLNGRLRLIDVHVVPYGIPLDQPSVDPRHVARRLRALASESEMRVSAEVVYARDWEQGFRRSLSPGSLVVIAMKRSWWPTSEKRFANRLRKIGHQIVWVECD